MYRLSLATMLLGLVLLAGCASQRRTAPNPVWTEPVPLYEGLGDYHRPVTTSSPLAQRYVDQGLVWAFAFNHDEAIRSFHQAARFDPDCAMAWWGIALCHGPHINKPAVPPARAAAAWAALQQAQARRDGASPVERALIDALAHRYADPQPPDRTPLDQAYADAMRAVWQQYPDDADVGTLYGEALMDLRPWGLWQHDGQPSPITPEVLAVLEEAMRLNPDHPGANHLYIHAVEASPHPERALPSAARLCALVPGSGHLTHMPSHVYVLTGHWDKAADQNELAIAADRRYRARAPRQDFYHVYMVHNHHMLAFAAMNEGRYEVALRAARELVESVPDDYLRANAALMDPYMGAVYDVLKRFGRWDDILREPAPPKHLPITTAMWRFARGIALAAKGQVPEAEREQVRFRRAVQRVPDDALLAINPAHDMLKIADHFLAAEIAYRRGELDAAVRELEVAIELEDQLLYMEPPEWMQPARHTLGAFLVDAKRYEAAARIYREDLERWPENGWSLHGLSQCCRALGRTAEADALEARFRKVWSRADTPIGTSCLCVQGRS